MPTTTKTPTIPQLLSSLSETALRLSDLELYESSRDVETAVLTIRTMATKLERLQAAASPATTSDTETTTLVERLALLREEMRERCWVESAEAVREAVTRIHLLSCLQRAAEPLAQTIENLDGSSGSLPDTATYPVTLVQLRSLARSLRSSRGGEAEPPRPPVPETTASRGGVAGRRGQQALDLLKTVWAELTTRGLQEYATKVTTVEGVVTFLKTEVAALEAEIARLGQPAVTPIDQPTVDVLKMRTSAGSDYYVRIRCGGREATPYRFRDRYPAEYEAAHLTWLLGLRPDEPDLMVYDEATYPNDPATRDRVTEFQDALRKSFSEEMAHMQVLLARALTDRLRAEERCAAAEAERDAARAEATSSQEQAYRG